MRIGRMRVRIGGSIWADRRPHWVNGMRSPLIVTEYLNDSVIRGCGIVVLGRGVVVGVLGVMIWVTWDTHVREVA